MIPAAAQSNRRITAKRVLSLVLAVLAVFAATYLLLEVGFELRDHFTIGQEPVLSFWSLVGICLTLAGILLFEAYRLVKYFTKKPTAP
jgi:uncharacterized membrane protein YdcZ (DUF606 family)